MACKKSNSSYNSYYLNNKHNNSRASNDLTENTVLDSGPDSSKLSEMKSNDEVKYTKLCIKYEEAIKKLQNELSAKELKMRNHIRKVQNDQRIEKINNFNKQKKKRDRMRKLADQKRLKEIQGMQFQNFRPSSNTNDENKKLQENVILEEKSRASDETKTQDFYKASSDEEISVTRSRQKSKEARLVMPHHDLEKIEDQQPESSGREHKPDDHALQSTLNQREDQPISPIRTKKPEKPQVNDKNDHQNKDEPGMSRGTPLPANRKQLAKPGFASKK